jgi:hypothetical protein
MVISTDGDFEKLPRLMEEHGFTAVEIYRRKRIFEVLSVLKIARNQTK